MYPRAPLAHAPHPVGLLVLARAHDDGHVGVLGIAADGARELEAVLAGHDHVHQDEVGLFLGQAAEGLVGVLGGADLHALLLQQVGQEHQLGLRVVNNQNFLDGHYIAPCWALPNC